MCNRFVWVSKVDGVEQVLRADYRDSFTPNYNIHPGSYAYVITDSDPKSIVKLRWGFVPHWFKRWPAYAVNFNASVNGIVKNSLYRSSIRSQRCLVLANCYYIWINNNGVHQPYLIYARNEHLITFAGIWSVWKDVDGNTFPTFAILTKPAGSRLDSLMKSMPVVIPAEYRRKYLSKDLPLRSVINMINDRDEYEYNAYPVSHRINDQSVNDKQLIQPVGPRLFQEFRGIFSKRLKNANAMPGRSRFK
mgnify:FL=1